MDTTISFTYRMTLLLLTLAGWMVLYFSVNRRAKTRDRHLDFGTEWV